MRPGTLLRYYAGRDILLQLIRDGDIVLDMGCYDGFILSKFREKSNIRSIALGAGARDARNCRYI